MEGAAYTKIFTSKKYIHKNSTLKFEFFLSQTKNNFLKIVKYIQDSKKGTKNNWREDDEILYKQLKGAEYDNIKAQGEWKTIEKKRDKKSNPDYEIRTYKRNEDGKEISYYMVLKIKKINIKTRDMIYKICSDKSI